MDARSSRIDWLIFAALGFFWGSSYLFIKIGVNHGLEPFTLIMFRLLIGFLLLATVVAIAREPLPRDPRAYGHLFVMGTINIAIPFTLITFAEQTVDSSLASVINSAVPLFVIVLAAIFLPGEAITVNRLVGLLVGFVGLLITGTLAFATEHPLSVDWAPEAILAVVWLGLLGSGLAYLSYFRILQRWGATRTSLVAYLLPVWGIALGAIVLGEPIAVTMLIGTALIIGGIALVNARFGTRPLYVRGGIRPPVTTPADPAAQPGARP